MIPTEQVNLLRSFVQQCKKYPSLLHNPRISFYKEYLESLGATIPPAQTDNAANNAQESAEQNEKSSSESELEFSDADVMEPEEEMSLPFGDETVEITEDMLVNCDAKQQEAMEAAKKGDYEQALKLYTEAICFNPLSTLLYGRRAGVLLNLKKPMTAIRDCNKAINLNPNAAIAYKYRGKANRMLGRWEDAYYDLCNASNLDYNEECYQWLKEVEEYAKKVVEHKRKKERKKQERKQQQKQQKEGGGGGGGERSNTAENAEEKKKNPPSSENEKPKTGNPFADYLGNMGGNMPDLSDFNFGNIMSDPEIMEAMKDPELIKVFDDVKKNPMNLLKYQSNPKISKMLAKLQSMFTPSSGQSDKKKDDNDDKKDGKSSGASMFADTNLD
ncbi:Hsc70-interacting protein [Trichinella zimbabwensis]|uniref:Hsc70-interacting protein n=1 Tax=Trichinella zimbabwensis TaxID=268475 RepID=A0A0V1HZR6_9BILA|nr:Hsc70-interacting protein [Trichinella zimbabwensis]